MVLGKDIEMTARGISHWTDIVYVSGDRSGRTVIASASPIDDEDAMTRFEAAADANDVEYGGFVGVVPSSMEDGNMIDTTSPCDMVVVIRGSGDDLVLTGDDVVAFLFNVYLNMKGVE
jgi:hypothetical protein